MLNNGTDQTSSAIIAQIDLHQCRRESLIPTLSVVVGHHTETVAIWQCWADIHERQVLLSDSENPLRNWLSHWKQQNNGFSHVVEGLIGKTEYELETLLNAHLTSHQFTRDEIRELRQLLQAHTVNVPPGTQTQLKYPLKWFLFLGALADRQSLPTLAVKYTNAAEITALNSLIRILYQLVTECPFWPIALLLEHHVYEKYKEWAAESREKALVRQGTAVVSHWDQAAIREALEQASVVSTHPLSDAIQSFSQLQPSATMVDDFVALASNITTHDTIIPSLSKEDDDAARSLAERLLFACLQQHPQTTGLFKLNARLPIQFGNAPMEVDLFAESFAIAVEIDGYYHFQNMEAYRRDRRKDLLLQKHGALVLRFLAEDVVCRLEYILDTIKDALLHQRALI